LANVDKNDPTSCLNAAEDNAGCKGGEGYFHYAPTTGACGCCKFASTALTMTNNKSDFNIYKGAFAPELETKYDKKWPADADRKFLPGSISGATQEIRVKKCKEKAEADADCKGTGSFFINGNAT
jgi:major membrane immunogen (membrane-anchored lipoprotein)